VVDSFQFSFRIQPSVPAYAFYFVLSVGLINFVCSHVMCGCKGSLGILLKSMEFGKRFFEVVLHDISGARYRLAFNVFETRTMFSRCRFIKCCFSPMSHFFVLPLLTL